MRENFFPLHATGSHPESTTQNAEGDLRFGHGARRLTRRPGRVAANQDHRAGALGQTHVDAAQLVWATAL